MLAALLCTVAFGEIFVGDEAATPQFFSGAIMPHGKDTTTRWNLSAPMSGGMLGRWGLLGLA
jgi:hypothetical protein